MKEVLEKLGVLAVCFCISLLLFIPATSLADRGVPFKLPTSTELTLVRSATITTDKGEIVIQLFPEDAPWHVANFKFLADQGYYRNQFFHLFRPNYVIQGGGGKSGKQGPRYTLPPEFSQRKHLVGTLSMVRPVDDLDLSNQRRSHASQFRIMLSPAPHMDGLFTVFGEVISGMDVVKRLREGDRILEITVYVSDRGR